jgi:HEAT repeat protein
MAPAGSLEEIVSSLPACGWSQAGAAESALDAVVARTHGDAVARAALESRLAGALTPGATQAGAQVICKKLATIGSARCVPALARLLHDGKLSHLARYALERIPDAAAGDALRDALGKTRGKTQAGIINSLAARKDAKAADLLAGLLDQSDGEVVGAALAALAAIGSSRAIDAVAGFPPKAPGELAARAKDACLQAAAGLIEAGRPEAAAKIYERLSADAAEHIRAGCLQGMVAAQPEQAPAHLAVAFAGESDVLRGLAVQIVRDANNVEADNCTSLFARLPPAGQAALLDGLLGRSSPAARAAALEGLKSRDGAVRLAALRATAASGTAADAVVLAELAAGTESPAIRQSAFVALCELRDKGADDAMVSLLSRREPKLQTVLIRALQARQARGAVGALLKIAKNGEQPVRVEACKALATLAGAETAGELAAAAVGAQSPEEREEAIVAAAAACAKIAAAEHRADPLLTAMQAADPPAQCVLLRALGHLGGPQALDAIHAARKNSNGEIRDAAISALADWPDATVIDELREIARTTGDESQRARAIYGLARIAPRPGQLPPPKAFEVLKEAMSLATDVGDRQYVLSRMAPVRTPECLAYVLSHLDDANLRDAAAIAAEKLAEAMKESQPQQARSALERVLQVTKDERLRRHIEKLLWNMKEKGN